MTVLLAARALAASTHGTIMLGGAKPVPVESAQLPKLQARRHHRVARRRVRESADRASRAIVAHSSSSDLLGRYRAALRSDASAIFQAMMIRGVRLNLVLIAFNLIPIPPLDGSHVMKYLLPSGWALRYKQIRTVRHRRADRLMSLASAAGSLTFWLRAGARASARLLLRWAEPLPSVARAMADDERVR